jgi:dolichol-phosphate mannosyltransferase
MSTPRTLVALATYNERETLPSLVDAVCEALPDADILVVDDNSPDGTGNWCDERVVSEPRLRCLHRAGKLGLGTATIAAMRVAIDEGFEVLVTMDADWSHDPQHLPDLVAATDWADVAIGSRYCPGGQIDGWPLVRRVVSRVTNAASRRLLRLPVRDASSAFRAYRISRLRELSLDEVQATGYAYLEEIVWHLDRAGATFTERPITFRDRRGGRSKASAREAIGKITTIGRLLFR